MGLGDGELWLDRVVLSSSNVKETPLVEQEILGRLSANCSFEMDRIKQRSLQVSRIELDESSGVESRQRGKCESIYLLLCVLDVVEGLHALADLP